ncbi:ATP-dependent zinc metalloprotease FtsH [uncultured Rikenella sp.]|uniref:ATP-dependent zinc metalloprotease FtsH n=1 Tax=uncultured Rikenella sp. TaxID=368003 RepID=UPI0026253C55|nr:ATP-dependent zinc metalloprotease FtsH [uncultured Rikenella sp.]
MANEKRNTLRPRFNIYWMWGIIIAVILGWAYFGESGRQSRISWDALRDTLMPSGDLQRVQIVNREVAEVWLRPGTVAKYKAQERYKYIPTKGPQFYFNIGSLEKFENDYQAARDSINRRTIDGTAAGRGQGDVPGLTFENDNSGWGTLFWQALPFIAIVVFWIILMRRMSGGAGGGGGAGGVFSVGKAKARLFDKDNDQKVTFKDVAGLEEVKIEVMEVVDFLRNPGKYSELGGKIPKGALLVGPPGTGKTLLAKAVAGEANVPFFSISGSDFVEMFVGVGASRVRDLFKQAKEKAPCIVFIDEIDAIGRARSKNSGWSSNDERENTLNQLLTEMDGFGTNAGVIILAATNRADILDKALLRAGRFDRQIEVGLPDIKERAEIFAVHLKKLKLDPDLDTDFLARQTPGFSGADIANVCNEAALIAARKNKKQVERQDFMDAVDRIIGGLERKNKILTDVERRAIAYHEAGHATVSWMLKWADPLLKVTIIPRGKALGAAWYLPDERQITTREQMTHEIASLLGGRASEELTFGEISSGALNDLERATKQAYAMVAYYGMSRAVGHRSFYDSTGQSEMAFGKPYSEETARLIDDEVNTLLKECYQLAKQVLWEQREGLRQLAELLLEREVIFTEDLERIFGKRQEGARNPLDSVQPAATEADKTEAKTEEGSANES